MDQRWEFGMEFEDRLATGAAVLVRPRAPADRLDRRGVVVRDLVEREPLAIRLAHLARVGIGEALKLADHVRAATAA